MNLSGVFTGLGRTAAIALAPLVTFGADKITGWLTASIPIFRAAVGEITGVVQSLYTYVSPIIDRTIAGPTNGWNIIEPTISMREVRCGRPCRGTGTQSTRSSATSAGAYAATRTIGSRSWARWLPVCWRCGMLCKPGGVLVDLATNVWDSIVAVWEWATEAVTGSTGDLKTEVTGNFTAVIDAGKDFADRIEFALGVVSYSISHFGDLVDLETTALPLPSCGPATKSPTYSPT